MENLNTSSIYNGIFNTCSLQKELENALEEDRIYKKTDNMKKRAIVQAQNYEEFKNLVACADLKPIVSKELIEFGTKKIPYNANRLFTKQKKLLFEDKTNGKNKVIPKNMKIKSKIDFYKLWRNKKFSNIEKYKLLVRIGIEKFKIMFRDTIEEDILMDIIYILKIECDKKLNEKIQFQKDNDNNKINEENLNFLLFLYNILDILAKTERFQLIRSFFDEKQKIIINILFSFITKQWNEEKINKKDHFCIKIQRNDIQTLQELYIS